MLLTLLFTLPAALAADADGDGVDSATDCDDADATVYRTSSTSTDYTLDTDAEVEGFCDTYCTRKVGELTLRDVTTSEGLSCVTKTGDLIIDAPDLDALDGLPRLATAEDIILFESNLSNLSELASLTSLSGLFVGCSTAAVEWVQEAYSGGDALSLKQTIEACGTGSNPSLTDLAGLERLIKVKHLVLTGGAPIDDLRALSGIGNATLLALDDLDDLPSLRGLDHFAAASEIYIGHSDLLGDLSGLGNLNKVTAMTVEGNTRLASMRGMSSLRGSIDLTIEDVGPLTDLRGLEPLTSFLNLTLVNLPSLEHLTGLEAVSTVSGDVQIIGAPRLVDLVGLDHLTSVTGRFALGCALRDEDDGVASCAPLSNLRSLEGADALSTVGTLSLVQLPALTRLDGLDALTTVSTLELDETAVDDLTGLDALTNLSTLSVGCHKQEESGGEDYDIDRWTCRGNGAFSSLEGLPSASNLTTLRLYNNDALTDLTGLETASRLSTLQIAENDALASLDALPTLSRLSTLLLGCVVTSVVSDSDLTTSYLCLGQPTLGDVPTVSARSFSTLMLMDVPDLASLSGLETVQSTSNLHIGGDVGFTDLSGLRGLVGATYMTVGCMPTGLASETTSTTNCMGAAGLESLDGLDAISTVITLQIQNNPDLADISALMSLGYVESISIVNNRELLTSDAEDVVDSIAWLEGSSKVRGNKP